jgi:hypothetical protein
VLLKVKSVDPPIKFIVSVKSAAFAGRVTGVTSDHTTIIFARLALIGIEVMLIFARAEFPTAPKKVALVGSYSILSVIAQTLVKPLTVIGTSTLEDGHASFIAAVVTGALRAKELITGKRNNAANEKLKNLIMAIFLIRS